MPICFAHDHMDIWPYMAILAIYGHMAVWPMSEKSRHVGYPCKELSKCSPGVLIRHL